MNRKPPARRQSKLNDALHPPVNVRVVAVDGTEYPVQTMYAGVEAGAQVYEIVDLPRGVPLQMRVLVGTLPENTSIVLPGEWKL